MPRMGRIVLPNYPHHVVQRGHNRQVVVFSITGLGLLMKALAARAKKINLSHFPSHLFPNVRCIVPPSVVLACPHEYRVIHCIQP